MRIYRLAIRNFRGIKELDWIIESDVVCLIGPNDSCKSTILDAIEYVLCDRWPVGFTDEDFYNCETANPIVIEATVGKLPTAIHSDEGIGHYLRGWDAAGGVALDDPELDQDSVITVKLTVNDSLEPEWCVTHPTMQDRRISAKDRGRLGVTRLGGEAVRHLSWGRGSALTRLSEDTEGLSSAVAAALRSTRRAVTELKDAELDELRKTARRAQTAALALGVSARSLQPGIDARDLAFGGGILGLHEGSVALSRAGLGTRRLVSLSIQREAVPDGAVLLLDEVEHGLEPFRLRLLLQSMCPQTVSERPGDSAHSPPPATPKVAFGQAIFTSHSPIAVGELKANCVHLVRHSADRVTVTRLPSDLQYLLDAVPEALLARRVLVCEGATELGICRGLSRAWGRDHGVPVASRGVAMVDGGGSQSAKTGRALIGLGYKALLLTDSDDRNLVKLVPTFAGEGGTSVMWDNECSIEVRICEDLPINDLQRVLDLLVEVRGQESILATMRKLKSAISTLSIEDWVNLGCEDSEIRKTLGKAANKGDWFKNLWLAERIGEVIADALPGIAQSDLAQKLGVVEAWIYADG